MLHFSDSDWACPSMSFIWTIQLPLFRCFLLLGPFLCVLNQKDKWKLFRDYFLLVSGLLKTRSWISVGIASFSNKWGIILASWRPRLDYSWLPNYAKNLKMQIFSMWTVSDLLCWHSYPFRQPWWLSSSKECFFDVYHFLVLLFLLVLCMPYWSTAIFVDKLFFLRFSMCFMLIKSRKWSLYWWFAFGSLIRSSAWTYLEMRSNSFWPFLFRAVLHGWMCLVS